MMEFGFRRAVPDDAPAVARLITWSWQTAYRGILSDSLLNGIDTGERSGRIRSAIEAGQEFRYYVLEADGEIAGAAAVCACRDEDLSGTAEIAVFYIQPDLQGRGYGREMMRRILIEIQPPGSPPAALWVLRDNAAARAFYEKTGFQADGAGKSLPSLEDAVTVRYRYMG